MTNQDQLSITARHEAGHAVAYLHYGWKFGTIKIYEKEDGSITGGTTSSAGRYGCFAYGIICLSGPIAEERLTGVHLDEQHNSYTDWMMARDALARVTIGDEPAEIESVLPFTRQMIEHNWGLVQLIASELVARKELDYEQVLALL
jgi:hypothetical protein